MAVIFIQYKGLTFSNSNHLFQVWPQKFRKLNHKRRQSEINNGTVLQGLLSSEASHGSREGIGGFMSHISWKIKNENN